MELDILQQNDYLKFVQQTLIMFFAYNIHRLGRFLGVISANFYKQRKSSLCFFVSPSFIQRNMVIRLKREPLLFVSFHKTSRNAKGSHDEHGQFDTKNSFIPY